MRKLKRRKAQGAGRYESWIKWTGCHLSEHPAMLWRVAVRRAHKDPVFLQRRQRQTHYSLARNVSYKAVQQHQISFLVYSFLATAAISSHTQLEESLVTTVFAEERDNVTSFACQMIVHDCAVISSVSCSFPHSVHYYHSHTVNLHGVTFSKHIFQICPVASINSGTVQLNADLDHASSLSLTRTTTPVNSSVSQVSVPNLKKTIVMFSLWLLTLGLYFWSFGIFTSNLLKPHEINSRGTKHNKMRKRMLESVENTKCILAVP